jgi:hypothetical protein
MCKLYSALRSGARARVSLLLGRIRSVGGAASWRGDAAAATLRTEIRSGPARPDHIRPGSAGPHPARPGPAGTLGRRSRAGGGGEGRWWKEGLEGKRGEVGGGSGGGGKGVGGVG